MINYSRILQTGIQSLLAVACGWACGKWKVLDAEPTVHYTNTLVLKFCIPCLQVWLLAIKTDMREPGNWSALGAFLVWSLSLQGLLAVQQLLVHRRLHLARLGVDSLILTTNNTGILGPVVLEAAVGSRYAPLGMLATVVLYFQQLPSAQLLFHLQQHSEQHLPGAALGSVGAAAAPYHRLQDWQDEDNQQQQGCSSGKERDCMQLQELERRHHIHTHAGGGVGGAGGSKSHDHSSPPPPAASPSAEDEELLEGSTHSLSRQGLLSGMQHKRSYGSADSLQQAQQRQHCQQQQQQNGQQQHVLHVLDGSSSIHTSSHGAVQAAGTRHSLSKQQQQQQGQLHAGVVAGQPKDSCSLVVSLLLKNPLVWSTGISLLLSSCGSSVWLDPFSPLALQQLAFLEQLLGWFAQTTAPLTLFTTGLWMYSNSVKQQQQQQCQGQKQQLQQQQQGWLQGEAQELPWQQLCVYLLARSTIAPAMMVLLCWLLGFRGDLAHALVILALLPVAQTAFVVCKQAETGTHAVSVVMVASLLLMLPQLMVMLALLEWLGVLT